MAVVVAGVVMVMVMVMELVLAMLAELRMMLRMLRMLKVLLGLGPVQVVGRRRGRARRRHGGRPVKGLVVDLWRLHLGVELHPLARELLLLGGAALEELGRLLLLLLGRRLAARRRGALHAGPLALRHLRPSVSPHSRARVEWI